MRGVAGEEQGGRHFEGGWGKSERGRNVSLSLFVQFAVFAKLRPIPMYLLGRNEALCFFIVVKIYFEIDFFSDCHNFQIIANIGVLEGCVGTCRGGDIDCSNNHISQ